MKENSNNKKGTNSADQLSRVDTLMITVGTRQVGWRCQDGVVRCLGTDGRGDVPPHTDELYKELGIERGYYREGKYLWSVRDLGEQFYRYCQETLAGDFKNVELLLDHQILHKCISKGLKHIILWGTDQPETVSWQYRRLDTLWLAQLMARKIQSLWENKVKNNQLKIEVWCPVINATDGETIRQHVEAFLLEHTLNFPIKTENDEFVFMIENKGAVPDIAEGLAICAAALVRQFQVLKVVPIEPAPSYEELPGGAKQACTSTAYHLVSIGQYFWPLERMRVISAWERGDFREAEIWLTAHQTRYEGTLYQLAGYLALSTNWQISTFLQDNHRGIKQWLNSVTLKKVAQPQLIQAWQEQLNHTQTHEPAAAWEACFLIYLLLRRGNFTNAFLQFSQCLERLLYIQYQTKNWLSQGYITAPDRLSHLGDAYQPGLKQLIDGWFAATKQPKQGSIYQLFDGIRNTRNGIVHNAAATTFSQIRSVWSDSGWRVTVVPGEPEDVALMRLMRETLQMVNQRDWQIPEKSLLQSLYEWGLGLLRKEPTI